MPPTQQLVDIIHKFGFDRLGNKKRKLSPPQYHDITPPDEYPHDRKVTAQASAYDREWLERCDLLGCVINAENARNSLAVSALSLIRKISGHNSPQSSNLRRQVHPTQFVLTLAEEIQETLLGILGFDDMDFIQVLVSHRDELLRSLEPALGILPNYSETTVEAIPEDTALDFIMDRDTRHKRLMEQANQHKVLDRAKPKVLEYPHVYGAPKGGNILDAFGRKYALPQGTERHVEDVRSGAVPADLVLRRDCGSSCATRSRLPRTDNYSS
jgi:hypothetical protein